MRDEPVELIDNSSENIGILKSLPMYLTPHGTHAIWKIRDRILIDEQNNQEYNELDLIRNYFCKVLNELNSKLDTEDEHIDKFIKVIESNSQKANLEPKQYLFQRILEATCVKAENDKLQYNPKDLAEIIILLNPKILQENIDFFKNIVGMNATTIAYAIYEKYDDILKNGQLTLPGLKDSNDDIVTVIKQNYDNYVQNVLDNTLFNKLIDQDILKQFEEDDHRLIAEEFAKLRRYKLNQDNDIKKLIESCPLEIMHQIVRACKYENSLEGFWGAFKAFFRWLQVTFERDNTRREQINNLLKQLLDKASDAEELIFEDGSVQVITLDSPEQLSPEIKPDEKGKEKEDNDIEVEVNGSAKVSKEYFNHAVTQHISRNQDSRQK